MFEDGKLDGLILQSRGGHIYTVRIILKRERVAQYSLSEGASNSYQTHSVVAASQQDLKLVSS